MFKISALNEDATEGESDNEAEEEVTREALEEIAMQQYAKILELQKKGRNQDALKLLKELLDTELLYDVKKVEGKESTVSPLPKLKYLCYKNIASISAKLGDKDGAVEAYLEASHLDDTDVTLWHRLGKISLELRKYDLALFAFQRGIDCNPKHWPCLDNQVMLLLGLGEYNECIITIYNALQLDSDYLRGRAYRKYIFTDYPHVQNYLAILNPIYKWTPDQEEPIDEEDYQKLVKEATDINEIFIQQVMETNVTKKLPVLTLNKPIENLTWLGVGESIVDMHMYISEKLLSHACIIKVTLPEEKISPDETVDEAMDVDVSVSKQTTNGDNKQNGETKNVEEKVNGNDSDKMDVDQVVNQLQEINKAVVETKDSKKSSRRRGSSVRFLQQWEWCNKRKSSRKKPIKPEQETLDDILKRLLPKHLRSEENGQEQINKVNKEFKGDDSMDTMDLYKLFEEKERNAAESSSQGENKQDDTTLYFNTEKEQTDVQVFIEKYVNSTCDIITIVDDFVLTLSQFWDVVWPDGLGDIYMEANWCSRQHSDPPLGYMNEENVLKNFIKINLMHLEVGINKLLEDDDTNGNIETELIDLLRMFCTRTDEIGDEALTLTLRFLWVKCHSLLYKGQVEFGLDCLYYIIDKLYGLEDEGNNFTLRIVNFTKWPTISKNNCLELIKSLERNKLLSTVPKLFDSGKYEEVIGVLQDSFKHCQMLANKQEWEGMSLDWGVQLVTLLESIWAINDTEQCFIWATICLRESLKQYTLCEQASDEIEKWSLVVVKSLICIEHILKTEGSSYLDVLSEKNIIHMIQDIIQVIVLQLDENYTNPDMPLNTVACWIILHYVFQREEDCGRISKKESITEAVDTEMPISVMILFMAHENLGRRGWCANDDSKLLIFTIRTVISRLRSPALSGVVTTLSQYLEQCVLCLFGHPSKKSKLRYLTEHNVTPSKLDWEWAQLIFDLYRPEELPEFNSYRLASITGETEQLFQNMLSLAPPSMDPHPHCSDVIGFIEGRKSKLHHANVEVPYKMRDIYYLLADYYLKNNETMKALKFYVYDIVICRKRFDSWAGMALARGSLLETKLNSCESFRNEMEYLNRATAVEFCYKQALEIDSSHSMLWIEYGSFVYGVHSFCSRMLKQASESLSMDSFEVLENKKETMLDTASKCFVKAHRQWMEECQGDDKGPQDERWLHYYMLGKIAEKKNEQPQKYLEYYQKAATFLQENNATYPSKINYSNPQNLSFEALEIQYRIHASILKYIEQHENKVICVKDGKCFKDCLEKCVSGPFSRKKVTKEPLEKKEQNDSDKTNETNSANNSENNSIQGASLKRSNSEVVDEEIGVEAKKCKIDNDKPKENSDLDKNKEEPMKIDKVEENKDSIVTDVENKQDMKDKDLNEPNPETKTVKDVTEKPEEKKADDVSVESGQSKVQKDHDSTSNTATSKDNTSSESSSDSNSSDSSSSSSSSSSSDSNSKQVATEMTQEEIKEIILICLSNLEDCVSRFPQHYKALYRLTHFHFYYKKEKNIERCRELMLGNFIASNGAKLQGLFSEKKPSNFFNSIWRIPVSEVDRPGSFATHMSRCILITMEILKELDDYKSLLELSLQLQKSPEADKKYLRESERIELFEQALSLCTRSVKGKLGKFNKVDDLSSTTPEKQEVANFMLELYKSYQKIQKNLPAKIPVFSALLVDCYKIYSGKLDSENLLDKSIKKCQSIIVSKRQQAQQAAHPPLPPSLPPPVTKGETRTTVAPTTVTQSTQPAQNTQYVPPAPKKAKPIVPIIPATNFLPHVDSPMPYPNMPNPFMSYLSVMDRTWLSALSSYDPTTAALYLSNLSNLRGIPSSALQPEIIKQFLASSIDTTYLQPQYPQSSKSKASTTSIVSQASGAKSSTKTSTISSQKPGHIQTSQAGPADNNQSKSTVANSALTYSNIGNKITQQTSSNTSKATHHSSSNTSTNVKPASHQSSSNVKLTHATSSSNGSTKSSHNSTPSPNANVKVSHSTSTSIKSNNTSSNIKPVPLSTVNTSNNTKLAHQSSSNSSSNMKQAYQSTPNSSGNMKPAHQPSSNSSGNMKQTYQSSSTNMKPAHQPSSNSSGNMKPAHQSVSNSGSSAKPTHQSSSNSGVNLKQAHQYSSTSISGAKQAHQSSSNPSGSVKPAHQSLSNPSGSVKPTHQSLSNPSGSVKPTHQSLSNPSGSVKPTHQSLSNPSGSVKPTHQSLSNPSGSVKPTHQSLSNPSGSVKPTHQSSSNTRPAYQSSSNTSSNPRVAHQSSSNSTSNSKITHQSASKSSGNVKPNNNSLQTTGVMPVHPSSPQSVSPGKTLQEKLAERQKQNPTGSKSSDFSSNRPVQPSDFSPKLPSSLTITKTSSSGSKSNSSPQPSNASQRSTIPAHKGVKDNRASAQQPGTQSDKLAQPKKPMDISEIIILDDD